MNRFLNPKISDGSYLIKELEASFPNQCLYISNDWALKIIQAQMDDVYMQDVKAILEENFAYILLPAPHQANIAPSFDTLTIQLGQGLDNAIKLALKPPSIEILKILFSQHKLSTELIFAPDNLNQPMFKL